MFEGKERRRELIQELRTTIDDETLENDAQLLEQVCMRADKRERTKARRRRKKKNMINIFYRETRRNNERDEKQPLRQG